MSERFHNFGISRRSLSRNQVNRRVAEDGRKEEKRLKGVKKNIDMPL